MTPNSVPNNNLSVLPWYGSIAEQNARRWWVYGHTYPLYCPVGYLLPFQIMREPYHEWLGGDYYDTDGINVQGEAVSVGTGVGTTVIDGLSGVERLYFYNVPAAAPVSGEIMVMAAAFDADSNLLDTFNPIVSGTYTGVWSLPAGTETVWVQTYNTAISPDSGRLSEPGQPLMPITSFELYTKDGAFVQSFNVSLFPLQYKNCGDFDVILMPESPVLNGIEVGQYYAKMTDGLNTWYSEVFTAVGNIDAYLRLEWWDEADFVMDAGTIVYEGVPFKNVVYLCAEIAKPEYIFEEEGEQRDGYFFPVKMVSEKRYRFSFLASEYMLDVLRFVRMADYAYITKDGKSYKTDTFLITPEWEANGDVASVQATFDTATVAKKIGFAQTGAGDGDFSNDFSNDFNTQ